MSKEILDKIIDDVSSRASQSSTEELPMWSAILAIAKNLKETREMLEADEGKLNLIVRLGDLAAGQFFTTTRVEGAVFLRTELRENIIVVPAAKFPRGRAILLNEHIPCEMVSDKELARMLYGECPF